MFWDFWTNHIEKGTRVFLRTGHDDLRVYRPSDPKEAGDLARSLARIRELGLYVDARENKPPDFPGREPAKPLGGTWPVRFLLPGTIAVHHAEAITADLETYLEDLAPRIEELRKARAKDSEKYARALTERWKEMQMRPVRVVSDFPKKPDGDFEVVIYGSDNPYLFRTLSAHYGVGIGGWHVETGKAERTLEEVLGDLDSGGRELLVRGPGNVVIDVAVSTVSARALHPGPNRFGIAFYEQLKTNAVPSPA